MAGPGSDNFPDHNDDRLFESERGVDHVDENTRSIFKDLKGSFQYK